MSINSDKVEGVVEHLLEEYDNATGVRQVTLEEAITITENVIEELQMRLEMLNADKAKA